MTKFDYIPLGGVKAFELNAGTARDRALLVVAGLSQQTISNRIITQHRLDNRRVDN